MFLSVLIRFVVKMFFSLFKNFSTKMVIIVRTDLKMSQGKIATQCAHAAVALYVSALESPDSCLNSWLYSGQPKIILKLDNEQALRDVYEKGKKKNLNACLVHDAGKTEVTSGTLTVVGLGPNKTDEIDELTKSFKLL